MNGQWLGTFTGSTGDGKIVLNIDERDGYYEGVAYTHPTNAQLPSAAAFFKTDRKDANCEIRTAALLPIDPAKLTVAPWEVVKKSYREDVFFSTYADVRIQWTGPLIKLAWNTDTGVTGSCELPRSKAAEPSDLQATATDWLGFKKFVSDLKGKRYLFRGQSSSRRLRTSFHRTGRADISRFHREDLPALRNHISGRAKHVFNFEIPDEFGAFLNLIQHHGYPTPLLDWTYSPYVAAFFAYRNITNERARRAEDQDKVRVLVFDQSEWKVDWKQILLLLFPGVHLSIGEFLAIENERMIPQQAASTVTSVDDIESYIKEKEQEKQKTYLTAIDLPIHDRREVMRDLRYMGITAGSLFPGLDGACEELKDRNFDI